MLLKTLSPGAIVVLMALSFTTVAHGQEVKQTEHKSETVYNPYPSGILPPDLDSELLRVLREVDFIEGRATARWKALMPPTLTNQSPVLANTGTEAVETLAELMNYDKNKTGPRDNFAAPCAAGSGYRSLLLEVRNECDPVVILDVCSQQPLQMRLVDRNQTVQQFAAATAQRSATPFCQRHPTTVRTGLMLMERIAAGTSMLYFES